MLPAEIIRAKRDGRALSPAQIQAFVRGLVDGGFADSQAAALAMAIVWRGMDRAECVALTEAMTHSGEVLGWSGAGLDGPVLDKHSTGGVGDKVSLPLAAIVAACGGVVPMISGRGLGHTGGTLDKLEALPGYGVNPPREQLLATLRQCGCAIVGAGADLAPADRRLYAIRDVTATVESVPLITASILSKKRAAGLHSLVMDVKVGSGAFMASADEARVLARSLVEVAAGAGLPTEALITDMDQPLGRTAGNALEVAESLDWLRGIGPEPRFTELTLALAARMLRLGGLAATVDEGRRLAEAAWRSGRAAERFARMVAALGGPADVLQEARLPAAPVQRDVPAPRAGWLARIDTRAVGLAVVALGGGRRRPGDAVDARVGFSQLQPLGTQLAAGEPMARVHAASAADAEAAMAALQAAVTLAEAAPAVPAVVHEVITIV
ncbi:MAG: thymidine phosphorylase [Burkholderiaceae bacterium]|nr:thymidine phosphorylase [Burkholderiaceae bacterium]